MPFLISPKLIPLIQYDFDLVWDERSGGMVALCPPSHPMTIKNDWGDMLPIQGGRLKQQLHKIATIYRNADEKISAVPRELLSVHAVAEVGRLRGTTSKKSQAGLIFQMKDHFVGGWDFVNLTPDTKLDYYGIFLIKPDGNIVGSERDYSFDDMVEREFAAGN